MLTKKRQKKHKNGLNGADEILWLFSLMPPDGVAHKKSVIVRHFWHPQSGWRARAEIAGEGGRQYSHPAENSLKFFKITNAQKGVW
ncbi:hypothetical protein [Acidithiobacillus sp.]|uniref:hypothetical protein n=1 Tax=Acidithiobacillus sp. TaxID=1872118 RepID=UPI003D06CCC7